MLNLITPAKQLSSFIGISINTSGKVVIGFKIEESILTFAVLFIFCCTLPEISAVCAKREQAIIKHMDVDDAFTGQVIVKNVDSRVISVSF